MEHEHLVWDRAQGRAVCPPLISCIPLNKRPQPEAIQYIQLVRLEFALMLPPEHSQRRIRARGRTDLGAADAHCDERNPGVGRGCDARVVTRVRRVGRRPGAPSALRCDSDELLFISCWLSCFSAYRSEIFFSWNDDDEIRSALCRVLVTIEAVSKTFQITYSACCAFGQCRSLTRTRRRAVAEKGNLLQIYCGARLP
jgi:hypothetical protein